MKNNRIEVHIEWSVSNTTKAVGHSGSIDCIAYNSFFEHNILCKKCARQTFENVVNRVADKMSTFNFIHGIAIPFWNIASHVLHLIFSRLLYTNWIWLLLICQNWPDALVNRCLKLNLISLEKHFSFCHNPFNTNTSTVSKLECRISIWHSKNVAKNIRWAHIYEIFSQFQYSIYVWTVVRGTAQHTKNLNHYQIHSQTNTFNQRKRKSFALLSDDGLKTHTTNGQSRFL